jgi:hypothetical protein
MRRQIWKVVGLLSGVVLAFSLAFVTGMLTLPPKSGGATEANANVTPELTEPIHPSQDYTETSPVYPDIPISEVNQLTQDWPLYVSEAYGFSIRYPPDFYTRTWEVSGVREMSISFIDRKWENHPSETPSIGITAYRNPERLPLQTWFRTHSDSSSGESLFIAPTEVESVKVANTTALKFVDDGPFKIPLVLVAREEYILGVSFAPIGPDNLEPLYELMLGTLKFNN